MITTPEEWSTLTDAERYCRLTRAELERDNAVLYCRSYGQVVTERQLDIVRELMAKGELIQTVSAA